MSTFLLLLDIVSVLSLVPVSLLRTCRYLSFGRARSIVCQDDDSIDSVKV